MPIYVLFFLSLIVIILINKISAPSKVINSIDFEEVMNSHGYNKQLKGNQFYNIFIFIIFIFSAIRFDVGWDFMAYHQALTTDIYTNIGNNGELFTLLLINVAKFFNFPQLYFILNSGICVFCISSVVRRYSKDPWMSMIIFVTFPLFYLNSFSVIRNFSAIAIVLYASRFIIEKKIVKYIIVIMIASQFHKSALIGFVFYPLKNVRLTNLSMLTILLISPIIGEVMRFIVKIFIPQYSIYLNKTVNQEGTKAIIIFLLLAIIIMLLKKYIKITDVSESFFIFYNNFIYGLLIYIIFFETGTMGHRLSLYGTIGSIILIPEIINLFKSKKERFMIKSVVYLFFAIFFFYIINLGRSTYIPYRIFINH